MLLFLIIRICVCESVFVYILWNTTPFTHPSPPGAQVGACHCRLNRTYRKCFVKLPRPGKVLHTVRRPRPTSLFDKARSVCQGSGCGQ